MGRDWADAVNDGINPREAADAGFIDEDPYANAHEGHEPPVIDVLNLNIKLVTPRSYILNPIIPERSICEVVGHRGTGKTWTMLSMGWAAAVGGAFLKWTAPKPRKVLYLDGEMDLAELKERTVALAQAMGNPAPGKFHIWTPDIADRTPDLSTETGQAMLEPHLQGVEVLFLDSVSTLIRSGVENDAESWGIVQDWALGLKRRGTTSVFAHHTGWGKDHGRGTSKREDVMHTIILLKESDAPSDGMTKIEMHLSKKRGIPAGEALPIEAAFCIRDGALAWEWTELRDAKAAMIRDLAAEGMTQRQIAKELGVGLATVNRALKQ